MFFKSTMHARFGLAVYLAGATLASANPVAVQGEGLRTLVPGAHIELDTPLNTVIPIRFTADGLMTGDANGLGSYLGSEKDRGRWRISGDQLCLKWFRWFDAEERCLTLKQDDTRIFWQEQDGKSGTATLVKGGETVAKPVRREAPKFAVASVSAPAKAALPVSPPAPRSADEAPPVPLTMSAAEPASAAPAASAGATSPPLATGLSQLTIISRAEAATPPTAEPANKPAGPAEAVVKAKRPDKPASKRTADGKTAPKTVVAARATARVSSSAPVVASPTYQVAHVEEDDVLNIRDGPSEYHEPVGEIPPEGRGVKIVGPCEKEWCPIAHGGSKGWVNRYYLAEEVAAAPGPKRSTSRATR